MTLNAPAGEHQSGHESGNIVAADIEGASAQEAMVKAMRVVDATLLTGKV
jgi:hypothetical protein